MGEVLGILVVLDILGRAVREGRDEDVDGVEGKLDMERGMVWNVERNLRVSCD